MVPSSMSPPLLTTSRLQTPPLDSPVNLSSDRYSTRDRTYNPDASLVFIGMRGVGKTTLGLIASNTLGWSFIDADHYLECNTGMTVSQIVKEQGWAAFRRKEYEVLYHLFQTYSTRHIIACGGGPVDYEPSRDLLKHFGKNHPVIHVRREEQEVIRFLSQETRQPDYGAALHDVWERRLPLYRECSTHEFVNLTPIPGVTEKLHSSLRLKDVQQDLIRFLSFVYGSDTNHVVLENRRTYFLSMTFDNVEQALPELLDSISEGVDALELRVDLLASDDSQIPNYAFIATQFAKIRHHSSLPIVFSVRSKAQGGKFPDNALEKYVEVLELGLALGAEYLDVELDIPRETFQSIVSRRGNTKIIGSWHDWTGTSRWDGPEPAKKFQTAVSLGSDIVKLVGTALQWEDNWALQKFVSSVASKYTIPLIAINMTEVGKASRVINTVFSPVCHPLQPVAAAPGQLSFAQIQQALHLMGLFESRKFWLCGQNIFNSLSPLIHNTSFARLGFPHHYDLLETNSVRDVAEKVRDPSFGGASITTPFKMDVPLLVSSCSEHARAIGAVNVVYRSGQENGVPIVVGDNTDWLGVRNVLLRNLSPINSVTRNTTAVVIGAGGGGRASIYALTKAGVQHIYLWNRTISKAHEVRKHFAKVDITVIDDLSTFPASIAPTIIVSAIPAGPNIHVKFPSSLFSSETGGIVVELAYRPRLTTLIRQVASLNDQGWIGVDGVHVLLEQGRAQFKLWTGRRAPKKATETAVLEAYSRQESIS